MSSPGVPLTLIKLRECIEKIELLKSPEERQCRIAEVPEIHADPKMSPNYESEEDIRRVDDDSKSEFARQSYAGFPRNGGKIKSEQFIQPQDRVIEKTDASGSHSSDKHTNQENFTAPEIGTRPGLLTSTATCASTGTLQSVNNVETEKFWHYRDPNGKIQGPFSMMQLRKWSMTGQFPSDTRIWMNHEYYDSLLLTDALNGHLCGELKLSNKPALRSQENVSSGGVGTSQVTNASVSSDDKSAKENVHDTSCRDPYGKIQGPFSMMQLRKWSTTGQFPSDTRIWMNHEQYDSLLLTDALNGHLCGESKLSNKNVSSGGVGASQVTNASVSSDDKSAKENTHDTSWLHSWNLLKDDNSSDIASKTLSLSACEPMEFGLPIRDEFKSVLTQSCMTSETQCKNVDTTTRSQNIDLNSNHMDSGSVVTTASKSPDLINIPDLHSLKPKVENVDIPGRHGLLTPKVEIIDIPDLGFLDLLSPTPRTNNEDRGIHAAEIDQSGVLNFPGPDLGASWSTAPGPTVTNEHVSTSVSDGHQIMHDSPVNTPNMSSWLEILNGTIEFDALGGESVSDLLAELNAMEPQGAPLASPTSAAKFAREFLEDCTDDCFSSIWDFSSTPYPQECEVKKSSANSYGSSVGETSGPVYSAGTGSEFHPSETNNSNQEMVSAMDPRRGTVQGNINLVTVQGNVNLVLGGPGQGMTNLGWGTNPNTNHNPLSVPWDGQRKYNDKRYTSPRVYQSSSEPGSVKGRPPRSRQSYNGGGYSRVPSRGQRLCKFYESGRCRKGANCDYLHP